MWEALTSAEFSRKYFSGNAVEVDLRIGGAFIVRTPDGSVHISGEVFECDPPQETHGHLQRQLAGADRKARPDARDLGDRTWRGPGGEAVKLTLLQSHDRPISDDILSGGRAGWPAILSSLKSMLETGQPMIIPMKPPERMLAALKELGIGTP